MAACGRPASRSRCIRVNFFGDLNARDRPVTRLLVGVCLAVLPCHLLSAQLPSIDEKTKDLEKRDGFLPLYWDGAGGSCGSRSRASIRS